jgi:cobalt-zinc-cadmium efflux system membrane fusion protein
MSGEARLAISKITLTVAAVALGFVAGAYSIGHIDGWLKGGWLKSGLDAAAPDATAQARAATVRTSAAPSGSQSVELNDKQLSSVKVEAVGERVFPVERVAVGSIDFNEELTVQVFTPYQGKIIDVYGKVGDEVKQGQTLFTIDSPDLLAANSNLIAAAGVLELTTRNLERLKVLYQSRAVSQHDLEQAVSDQQTAEGNLRAARDAVRIFGKTEAEVNRIVAERMADPRLVVPSPIAGRITARNAAPGLLVQPGSSPSPFSIADISTMWMLANIAESDVPLIHLGQEVKVSVLAYPGKVFEGRVTTMDSMVDPNTHRMLVRSTIDDPNHELRSNMFATFSIRTGDPVRSLAVPLDGVVREGDGTMTVWVTSDRRRFTQRTVRIGMPKDGFRQILGGLQPGELVATDGAVFLSNMLVIGQTGG